MTLTDVAEHRPDLMGDIHKAEANQVRLNLTTRLWLYLPYFYPIETAIAEGMDHVVN